MNGVNLSKKLATFSEHWQPRTIGQFNGHDLMVVKAQGEFVWHKHDDTDDFFLVLKGRLTIELRDRNVTLGPGRALRRAQGRRASPGGQGGGPHPADRAVRHSEHRRPGDRRSPAGHLNLSPSLSVVGLAAFVILAASPALGQQPRSGGWLALRAAGGFATGLRHPRERDDLDHVAGHAMPQQSGALRSAEADPQRGHGHRGARRAMVMAGELPQAGLLSPEGRQVARRQALQFQGRQVHLRHAPRGAGGPREAASEPAEGMVRQRGSGRGPRSTHRRVPPEAAAARPCSSCWLRDSRLSTPLTCRRRATGRVVSAQGPSS